MGRASSQESKCITAMDLEGTAEYKADSSPATSDLQEASKNKTQTIPDILLIQSTNIQRIFSKFVITTNNTANEKDTYSPRSHLLCFHTESCRCKEKSETCSYDRH